MKNIFIGQLSYSTTEAALRSLFEKFDSVQSVKVINDQATGRSRGFGFVEFQDAAQADEAISSLDGTALDGRNIVVREARPQAPRSNDRFGGRDESSRERY